MNQWNILKRVPAEPESVQEIFERELTAQLQKRISKMSRSDRELLLSAAKRAKFEKGQKVTPIEHLPRRDRGVDETMIFAERPDGSAATFSTRGLVEKQKADTRRANFRDIVAQPTWNIGRSRYERD